MRLVFLAEVQAFDPKTEQMVTLRMCSRGQGHVSFDDDAEYIPCIVTPPVQSKSFSENGVPGEISVDYGSMTIAFSDELRNSDWRRYDFDSYPAKMWWGEYGATFDTFRPIPAGRVGSLALSSAVQGQLAILGPDTDLRKSLLSQSYAGSGGAEGTEDMKGVLKPFRIGFCENIEVLLIDPVNLIYQFHGYGPTGDVVAVYENALTLGDPKFAASDYDELAGYTTDELPPGTWAKCPAEGMFRLGAEVTGKLTADVIGASEAGVAPQSIGAICSYVLRHHAGISADLIDEDSATALDQDFPHRWGDGVDAQTPSEDETDPDDPDSTAEFSVGEFVRSACSQIAAYLFADANGVWHFGRNVSEKEPITLQQGRTTAPIVIDITMPATSTRVKKVRVGGRRCFSVNSPDEISSALKDAVDAAVTDAADASDKADNAQNDVTDIRTSLPNLVLPILQKPIDDLSALHLQGSAALTKATVALHKDNLVAIRALGTRIDENGSQVAEDILQLTSRVDNQDGTISGLQGDIEAGLSEVNRTIANLDFATSETVDEKIANYGEGVTAAMSEEQRVRAEKDSALAENITQLGTKLSTGTTTLQGQIDDLKELVVSEGDDSALAQQVHDLGVKITDETQDREAAISTLEQAIVNGDKAQATKTDTLGSSLQIKIDAANTKITTINGEIQTIQQTEATNNAARAKETKALQSRLDDQNGASIEEKFSTQATLNGKFEAAYTLKVQTKVNGTTVFGGYGVVAEDGIIDTAFTTNAFRIMTPGGTPKQIFYADGNGILMDKAFIGKLDATDITVTNASIQDLTLAGEKLEPAAVTSVGGFERNYNGYHYNNAYDWTYIGGTISSAPTVTIQTGNGDSKALVTCTGVWKRDGGDDDNINLSCMRQGGSGTVYLPERTNVQVASGSRTFSFQWLDTGLTDNTEYTYVFVHRKIGSDGTPYWYNVTFNAVCFKK